MERLQAFFLALIQGVSEFLPVSSSAHLILPAQLLGWPDQGLLFDVAVHVGSLAAVVFYYRHELRQMASAWCSSLLPGRTLDVSTNAQARLAWLLVLATLPALLAGLVGKSFVEQHLRSTAVIATTTIVFGLLLGLAEWRGRQVRQAVTLSANLAVLIGLAQVLALVPGTSRSGVTITAAVLLGMSRREAANFSFLLSIPIIAAAGMLLSLDLLDAPGEFDPVLLGMAVLVSALSAWSCIALFLRLIERIGLMPFVWYRLALGAVLLWFVAQGS
ncbi:MAG: undecaprenyl-diphosphate phosphatase [Pseudomonadales bacterium]